MTDSTDPVRFLRERVAHARSRELAAFERWLAATDDYDVKLGAWFECRDVLSKAVAILNDELVHRARLASARCKTCGGSGGVDRGEHANADRCPDCDGFGRLGAQS